jgi:hypothetical protein
MEVTVKVKRQHKIGVRARTAALSLALLAGPLVAAASAQESVSFKDDVFPVIELRCLECHQPDGAGYETTGLDMSTYDALMKGTKHGPIVTPGSWVESNLLAVIDQRTEPELWMPHNRKPLSKCEKLLLRFWVMQGAPDN